MALGYKYAPDAIKKHVDVEDKGTIAIRDSAYETRAVVINESGLYSLILSSKLEQARGPRNLLEMLPEVFTLEDAKRVRMAAGLDTQNTAKMIRNWKNRNYVTQNSEFSFQKNKRK